MTDDLTSNLLARLTSSSRKKLAKYQKLPTNRFKEECWRKFQIDVSKNFKNSK